MFISRRRIYYQALAPLRLNNFLSALTGNRECFSILHSRGQEFPWE